MTHLRLIAALADLFLAVTSDSPLHAAAHLVLAAVKLWPSQPRSRSGV